MTLEDFFTLTEMRDGLTVPSRVEELVSVMQKEKDYVLKNAGDAIRQWAAVASTIAATESKECLDLFVQLDGVSFIDRWLKDAEKFENDSSDSLVEESMTVLLHAIKKLDLDTGRSISSGIWITIKNLLGHRSEKVQDSARALFESWKHSEDGDNRCQEIGSAMSCDNGTEEVGNPVRESGQSACSDVNVALSNERGDAEDLATEPAGHENFPSRSPNCLQRQKVEDDQIQTHVSQLSPQKISKDADVKDRSVGPLASSPTSGPIPETNEVVKESSTCPVEGTPSLEISGHSVPQEESGGRIRKPDTGRLYEIAKQEDKLNFSHEKLVMAEKSPFNAFELTAVPLDLDTATANAQVAGSKVSAGDDINSNSFRVGKAALGPRRTVSEVKNEKDDKGILGQCNTVLKTVEDSACSSANVQKSSVVECSTGKPDVLDIAFLRREDRGAAKEDEEHSSDDGENVAAASNSYRLGMEVRGPSVAERKRSRIELEYGIVDAIEVARQVAQEVEREMNLERDSEVGIRQRGSPEPINAKQDVLAIVPSVERAREQNDTSDASSEGEGSLINPENMNTEQDGSMHEMESSQVTEATQEPEDKMEKGMCAFDLNQEVSSDDVDCTANAVSTPVSVVSASKPAASAAGLPPAPLQFEGSLGWKNSPRSAFRPASPRRSTVAEKTVPGEESHDSKQRHTCLDIDLNVAEGGDDKAADLMPGIQIPVSSSLRSGESSVEVSSKRSERFKLDLNRIGDDGEPSISDFRGERQLLNLRNGQRSPSPASSSSTMRNFDLNDRPLFHNDFSDQGPYGGRSSQNVTSYGKPKSEPVISLFGAKVEVDKKDHVPQSLSLLNGKGLESAADAGVPRGAGFWEMGPTISYPPPWAYNGLNTGPAVSLSSTMYRPGYMVDPRVNPFVPQAIGSVSPVLSSFPQPPFMMTSAPLGLNGPGPSRAQFDPSRAQFDLNSGFTIDGVNREQPAVLRQFLVPDQGRSMEEHMRVSLQPSSSSGLGGKRKEPEGGWESYPIGFRQQQPPWK